MKGKGITKTFPLDGIDTKKTSDQVNAQKDEVKECKEGTGELHGEQWKQ